MTPTWRQLPKKQKGTTVRGSFDPLDEIADFCEEKNLWMHVDGALGGTALFSDTHASLMKGVERAHSLVWNAHKAGGAPLQSSFFVTRAIGALQSANACGATYLFQKDKQLYDCAVYDTGDRSLQCGRKQDILKVFLMIKARGTRGLGNRIDKGIANARTMARIIRDRDEFILRNEPEFVQICFW